MQRSKQLFKWLLAMILALLMGACATTPAGEGLGLDAPITTPGTPPPPPSGEPDSTDDPCVNIPMGSLCASLAEASDITTSVSVRIQAADARIQIRWPFIGADFSYSDPIFPFLMGSDGMQYAFVRDLSLPPEPEVEFETGEQTWGEQQLNFDPMPAGIQPVAIYIPLVAVVAPVDQAITIDLGESPGPGSTYTLAETLHIAGQAITFSRAELDGQNQLHLYSEPIGNQNGVVVRWLFAGLPEGWTAGVGPGTQYNLETGIHHIWMPLVKSDGPAAHGPVSIPVHEAILYLVGPFEIPLD